MNNRGISPVVGKTLEAGIVVLYIGLMTTVLYGGVAPEFRGAAGDAVAERTVSNAATDIQRSVPPDATAVDVRTEVELPNTIAGSAYRIRAENDRLVVDHPRPEIDPKAPLVLPERVVSVSGTWESGGQAHVRVVSVDGGLEVHLE